MKNIEILLKNKIKKFGGISVESFFNVVLYHEEYGYYKKSNITHLISDIAQHWNYSNHSYYQLVILSY